MSVAVKPNFFSVYEKVKYYYNAGFFALLIFLALYQGNRKSFTFITSFHSMYKQNRVYSCFRLEFYVVTLIINMLL